MAARILKPRHQDDIRHKFYVYRLNDENGKTLYVGKGSGARLNRQKSKFSLQGEVVCSFKSEAKAYQREKELISLLSPKLNKYPGGNGSKAAKTRLPKWVAEIESVGTKTFAARLLLSFGLCHPSKLDDIRQVAYGYR
jgi:hypothetical protein